ncbi:MAG: fuconate dehydratase [bacterium]|nr:fuconate dehydratase [bacterium]MDE0668814.1 fuconate dehydratase [bacterium]MXZ31702.1 fuconate dehydratase [Acidimicrobiia bacterium]MYB23704.1 fuconate dehydratase [Acidimicrobiia bacterium]
MTTITGATVIDLRFPTSRDLDGSDAMNPDPDYSAAYLRLATSEADLAGHGFVFTIGRGNDVQAVAVEAVAQRLVGRAVDSLAEDPRAVNRELAWDSQLRWLGPEAGLMHMAIGATMSAVWDLRARREGWPLWATLAAHEPAELVSLVDWTYIADFLDPGRAREILEERKPERQARIDELRRDGLAAYATTPGWLGYSDEKLVRLCREAVADGFTTIKLKVGADTGDDRRRLGLARAAVGPDVALAVDANQRWSVPEAIAAISELAEFDLLWVEEPTHPADVVGHATIAEAVRPVPIATGEMLAGPTLAKQLLHLGGVQVLQIDATRMGGPHDLLATLLMAAAAGVDVIPHAGGVGLCEAVQHYAFFNAICVAADPRRLALEHVDHLHEHMADPVQVSNGRYRLPTRPGASTAFQPGTELVFGYPTGTEWRD